MELETQQAPPVVAVVVVHEPGEWFDETIDALADQDYPNLRFLFLASDADDELQTRIKMRMPKAFVRTVGAHLGFGATANEVLRLVEGDKGFFLFCHDDVAPEPDAVRLLVEEIYRSNAGMVGPKIVEWDDPGVLQTVGLGVDRFGEIDVGVEVGEMDQEQHDGVRDVFALPSAFLLARADLFREIGGFDPSISFYGDDIDLCWRLHHSGARVIVVPTARVRHRGELAKRRPDLHHGMLKAKHRMRTVATLTGSTRLPGRTLELVLLTLAELVGGIFTGRLREAWASLRALVGLLPRSMSLLARRRAVKPLRRVPEREVLGLQIRGSARLTGFLRTRETATFVGADSSIRRWKDSTTAPVLAWIGVLAAILIGSRQFISSGVPAVGEFLSMPESPRVLLSSYTSAWNGNGFGATSANPTGWATLSGLSVFTLFRMGALHTGFIIGLVIVGLIGVWKLATVFPSVRARIAALVVYAASPLVVGAMSTGRLTVLIAFASSPWIVHTIRRAVGVETADPRSAALDLADGVVALSWPERTRRTAGAALVIGLAAAFTPVMVFVALAIAIVLGAATLLALAPWRTALLYVGVGIAASIGGLLLNFPWFPSWSWEQLVGPPPIGDPGVGLADLASFQIGIADFAYLSLALYVPVIAAIALGRAWRLTWAVRSGLLVVVFGAAAILADSGSLPFNGPEAGVLLAPVAVGLAISSAAALAAFDLDVRGGSFGWRQPLGLLASVGVVIGVFPGVVALGDGAWNTPTTPLSVLIEAQLPDDAQDRVLEESNENGPLIDPGVGGYNVLLVGDARLLPVPAVEYRDGVSYAVIGDRPLDIRDRWAAPDSDAADAVEMALDQMASSSTLRAGRLLAPLGIRFIVVPEFDNVESTTAEPLPLPGGLISALEDQLDLTSVTGLPTLEVFANTAWLPVVSQLTGTTAEASESAGAGALVRADLSSASPAFLGADQTAASSDDVVPGVIHLAVPFDENWSLTVEGESIEPRRAFGVTTAFDVERQGNAVLEYSSPSLRLLLLLVQVVLWLAVLFAAARVSIPLARRRGTLVADETLIDFDDLTGAVAWPVLDPGLDMTGQVARAQVLPIADGDGNDTDDVGGEIDEANDHDDDDMGDEIESIDAEQVDADLTDGRVDESAGDQNEGDR
ncbi:MAG: glycosyltransferase [Ilumatobacter sp.]|uniref:glycosyltransferase n=1 Tax=Ilumatobacter sp. TaxID=1967498 RepID=UPI003751E6CE|nr:glycosyltransferase [Ilumatobacter sp.]